ncbi:AAA family ATPase [Methylobacterium symbioticum]|uniref:ATP-dependent nuclease n=1 Tax=Methylobacterium symbioticum TaxID=2584084 RepID=UPI003F6724B7
MTNFEQRLFNALRNPEAFNRMLGEVLGFMPVWTIDQSDQGAYFLKFFNGPNSHSSDGMGEGIVSIFSIVDSLYDSDPGEAIFIDEPELSLHPALQKRLARLLMRLSSDRQIVISTHSPYFVDPRILLSGGQFLRVTTGTDGTQLYQLSEQSIESIRRLSAGNLYNPHVFGLDARELFFQEEGIILTEGQEDVLLYPKLAEKLGVEISGDFFGWGVGGAGNMQHLCLILRDLGFKKVAGLLDGDKEDVQQKLQTEFPDFFFACIPAKDIRTKSARKPSEAVEGLFDDKLEVRTEYIESTRKMLADISTYIDGAKADIKS